MASAVRPQEGGGRSPAATVFVSDPTPEAERIGQALRSANYVVVDVPLSMLVARVAVQRPWVVVVDADNDGALDIVVRIRELPDADAIQLLFIARPGGAITTSSEALAHEGSGLIVRPVDLLELVRIVNALTSLRADAEAAQSSATPPTIAGLGFAPSAGAPWSLTPASIRAGAPAAVVPDPEVSGPDPAEPTGPPFGPDVVGERTIRPSRRVADFAPVVSPELEQLLADAEQRVQVRGDPEADVPSPDDEIEALLPAEWLAALDEPLEEGGEDDDSVAARSVFPTGRDGTAAGGPLRGRAAGRENDEEPLTPSPTHTHGGTQSGSTSGGGTGPNVRDTRERGEHLAREPFTAQDADEVAFPPVLGPGDAMRVVARAIARRTTGSLCLASSDAERRIILREGDVVTASSSVEDESLLAFLIVRGDLPREKVGRVGAKFPAFGRHAAAALVARGHLRQDQLWVVLRAHAEWLLARALPVAHARLTLESHPSRKLAHEPSVFGASAGAEVFVEVVRRILPPADAVERLGGNASRISDGPAVRLLPECALGPTELRLVREAGGRPLADLVDAAPEGDLATVVFALSLLGVVTVVRSVGDGRLHPNARSEDSPTGDVSALDAEALRERVRARLELVDDGDYFALLGVARDATGYEVRRAFLELRRALDPSRVLTPDVADLAEDIRKIVLVLEEAYDILKDSARRERYRQAIES